MCNEAVALAHVTIVVPDVNEKVKNPLIAGMSVGTSKSIFHVYDVPTEVGYNGLIDEQALSCCSIQNQV
ncbi:hypothetical protein PVAND_006333 [Polypedilum vanderplanki]|uniref:Uncharacterized protein n=1 Tax=Polypedilum vanderplanki TaxID=319348 RepID=A0A9J6C4L5_POLVA|nr:hypothetical protein PVAND_006333 [Polypedilum vanderplanki]